MENKWDEADIADLDDVKTPADVYLWLKNVWAPAIFPMTDDPALYPGGAYTSPYTCVCPARMSIHMSTHMSTHISIPTPCLSDFTDDRPPGTR